MLAPNEPQVLRPYHRSEALSIAEAALIAGRSVRTIRDWCARLDIGRRIGGQWAVSRVALAMFLDGDREALAAYLRGDRTSPMIAEYFASCRVPLQGTA
jgi:helix-turn-helix protein